MEIFVIVYSVNDQRENISCVSKNLTVFHIQRFCFSIRYIFPPRFSNSPCFVPFNAIKLSIDESGSFRELKSKIIRWTSATRTRTRFLVRRFNLDYRKFYRRESVAAPRSNKTFPPV